MIGVIVFEKRWQTCDSDLEDVDEIISVSHEDLTALTFHPGSAPEMHSLTAKRGN